MRYPATMKHVRDQRLDDLPIDYIRSFRRSPSSLVVLMPAALGNGREDRSEIFYTRGRWESEWPESEVVVFADPAMGFDHRLNGAWFMSRNHDVIAALAEVVKEIVDELQIQGGGVVVYGSSLGGFGALMLAAMVDGAKAVAEVPQLDFGKWYPQAISDVEKYILEMPLSEFRMVHPERVSVLHRFKFANRIPSFHIITNMDDPRIVEQRNFMRWVRQSKLPKSGTNLITEHDQSFGHKVLSRKEAVPFINHSLNAEV